MTKVEKLGAIGEVLRTMAKPQMKPKDLMKAARKRYPKASKKDIVRAAFYSMIVHADEDRDRARRLQEFGIRERGERGGATSA